MIERHQRIIEAFTTVDEKGKQYEVLKLAEFYQVGGKNIDTEDSYFYELRDEHERLTQISETEFRRLDSEIILRRV